MDNSLSLSADVPEKLMTTKQLAQVLGVSVDSVNRTANKLFEPSAVMRRVIKGGESKVFTEEQATLIKVEIQKRHNLANRKIDTVTTECEENQIIANAMAILQRRSIELQQKLEIVEAKNEALASDVLTWADRKVIQAIISKYGANVLDGNFQLAWSDYKKELLYKYSINLNSRKTAYLNNGGKESNLKVLNLLDDSELPDAVRTAIAMAEKANLDISEIVEKSLSNQLKVIS